VLAVVFTTYTDLWSSDMHRLCGPVPQAIVPAAVSAPVVVFLEYIDTLFEDVLATYTDLPSADILM
jgi:hypothetical protein